MPRIQTNIGIRTGIGGQSSGVAPWSQRWYGVEINEANSSPDVTRIASDMSLHASLPVQNTLRACLLNDNGNVNYYLDPADWTKKASGAASNLDGTDGQVMMEWPDFWYKYDNPSAGVHDIKICEGPAKDFVKVAKHYVSAYEAALNRTTNKLASVKNITTTYRGGDNNATVDAAVNTRLGMPATNINRTNGRTYARNRGTGWNQYGYDDHKWLWWFFVIEYATLNSQKAINITLTGQGYKQGGLGDGVTTANSTEWSNFNGYNPYVICGVSNSLGNGSGVVNIVKTAFGGAGVDRTFSVPRYRGHENPFGHIWKIIDGINVEVQDAVGGKTNTWVADNPANWNDANYTNYTNHGEQSRTEGYQKYALMGVTLDFVPKAVGAASNTYYCDYYYTLLPTSGSALRMLLVGGHASNGAAAGFVYSLVTTAPSDANANFGLRLCFKAA